MFKFKGGSSSGHSGVGGLYAGTAVEADPAASPASAAQASSTSMAPGSSTTDDVATEEAPKKAWSAALGFAPPRRKPAHANQSKKRDMDAAVAAAQPVLYTAAAPPSTSVAPSMYTNNKPQAMEEEDINGFRSTGAGLKAQRNSKKKKKGKGRELPADPSRDWTADYIPAKPNDYTEYKTYVTRKRAEQKELKRQQDIQDSVEAAAQLARPQNSEQGDESGGDYDDDDDDDQDEEERDRQFKAKAQHFAPPKSYDTDRPPTPPSQPIQVQESGDDAYARRMAMSNPHPQPVQESGEDAFARRMAMSQSQPQPQILPPPPDLPQPPPSIPAPAGDKVSEAQAKARAIAERLGKLGSATPAPTPAPATSEQPQKRPREEERDDDNGARPNPQAFAERLMSKYGWKKGQGLGAAQDGIVNPLSLQDTGSKKQQQQQQEGGSSGRRGYIVSETKEAKDKAEKDKFGEPSRFVLLTNLVGRSEVDDDLPSEIAEEAQKYGIVQRCFVHTMPMNASPDEEVRVFIVFSGMVGAWKAVKDFEGRFFNGRNVRARFFPDVWAEREIWGMHLD